MIFFYYCMCISLVISHQGPKEPLAILFDQEARYK